MALIKVLHSEMVGALSPGVQYNGSSSSYDALSTGYTRTWLRQILSTGFNSKTPTTVSVAAGIATVTYPSDHNYELDTVIQVEGSTTSGLNGEFRVLSVPTTSSLTFAAPDVANGIATGTITTKYAPFGWPETGTATHAYRSNAITGTGMVLQSNPTGAFYHGTLSTYRSVGADNLGSGLIATRHYWIAPNMSFTNMRPMKWIAVGDDRTLYVVMSYLEASIQSGNLHAFGDFEAISEYDPYAAIHFSNASDSTDLSYAVNTSRASVCSLSGTKNGAVPTSVFVAPESYYHAAGSAGTSATAHPALATYPNQSNAGLMLSRLMVSDQTGLRGYLRGLYLPGQNLNGAFNIRDTVLGNGPFAGRKLMALRAGSGSTTNLGSGTVFVDITGPWGADS